MCNILILVAIERAPADLTFRLCLLEFQVCSLMRKGERKPSAYVSVDVFKEKRRTTQSSLCRATGPDVDLLACELVGKPRSHYRRSTV